MQTQTAIADPREIEDLYNALMWGIEPELTTELLGDLDYLYKNETPEERELRGTWYGMALELFADSYQDFVGKCFDHLSSVKQEVIALGKNASKKQDAETLSSIEDSLEDA